MHCTIYFDIIHATKVCVLTLVFSGPPSLTRITSQETHGMVGNNFTLLLVFNGGHTPLTAEWRRNTTNGVTEEIVEGGRVLLDGQHSINLTITDLVLSDAGIYELNVTNQIDSLVFRYTVLVFGEC